MPFPAGSLDLLQDSVEAAAKKEAAALAKKIAQEGAEKLAKEAAEKAAKEAAEKAAKEAAEKKALATAADQTGDLAATEAKKASKEAAEKAVDEQAKGLTGKLKGKWDALSPTHKLAVKAAIGGTMTLAAFITYWQTSGKSLEQALHDAPQAAAKGAGGAVGGILGAGVEGAVDSALPGGLPDLFSVDWGALVPKVAAVVTVVLFVGGGLYLLKEYAGARARAAALSAIPPPVQLAPPPASTVPIPAALPANVQQFW